MTGETGPTGPIGGSDTQVLFNNSGAVGGTSNLTYVSSTNTLNIGATIAPTTNSSPPPSVTYLVVGGGGGGGSRFGGGGGAGGYRTGTLSVAAGSYTVTVGTGGAGGPQAGGGGTQGAVAGTNGNNSVFSSITSVGGGGGGGGDGDGFGGVPPTTGGSGGGAAGRFASAGAVGTAGQGNAGASTSGTGGYYGGGGGGAGASGTSGTGGIGTASSITGTSTYYAGGGGGGADSTNGYNGSPGGTGGGGAGSQGSAGATNGTANTGGGGGGSAYLGGIAPHQALGGTGGSGIVVISYSSAYAQLSSIGSSVTYSYSVVGENHVYVFTAGSDSITWADVNSPLIINATSGLTFSNLPSAAYTGSVLSYNSSGGAVTYSTLPAAGSDTQITFNSGGVSTGDPALTFDVITGTTTISSLTITYTSSHGGTATFSSNVNVTYSGSSPGLTISGTDTVGGAGFINFLRVTNTSSGVTNPTKTFRINQVGGLGIVNNAYNSEIFNVTDGGILQVGGGNTSATINNSPTTNYLLFNNNGSAIYDDGNLHIHTMQDGGTMWINTSGGQISMISQTISGGDLGTGVGIGTSTLTAYVTISGSKTYTIGAYGYLHPTLGAGTGAGTTAPYSLATSERIQATEFDATSDERLKDISGGITAEEAIRFVQSVSGMYYAWKSDPSGGVHTGFIAQDIHKAGFDHMVSTIPNTSLSGQVDNDGYTHPEGAQLTLNYSAITPYHHEAIKVLLDRVARLEAQISSLLR